MAQKATIADHWQLAKVNEAEERDILTQGQAKEKAALKNRKATNGEIEKTQRGNQNPICPRQKKDGIQMNGPTDAHTHKR